MFTPIITTFFILSSVAAPSGSTVEGPRSVRSFSPDSLASDDALRTYLENAGPIAIEFFEHASFLTNPWLAGRAPGSDGSTIAGQYITWNLEQNGLEPAFGDSWYQPFDFDIEGDAPTVTHALVQHNGNTLEQSVDYVVLGNSGNGSLTAPVTFVGYAIENGNDDYSSFDDDTDLTGQIALMLRYEPLDQEGVSLWSGRRFGPKSAIRDKMQAVVDRGAAGVILVNPPNCRDGRRGLETMRSNRFGSTNIPVVQFSHAAASNLLGGLKKLEDFQSNADTGSVTTVPLDADLTLETAVETTGMHAQNVGGILQGRGELAKEWVVIGGHYDHLGFGYTGTSSRGELHVGADDNASGTAAVLVLAGQLAKAYANNDDTSLRSVLFLLFDAEEAGLYGSDAFVDDPIMDLADINVMINIDMVGRLRDNNLSISGTGTATEFEELVPKLVENTSMTASLTTGGTGPSDHTNFYINDIPVLFFFTGLSDEYHTPQDRLHTLNPAGAAKVIALVRTFADNLVDEPKVHFTTNTKTKSNRATTMSSPVRLGVHPSYTEQLETGILLTGVSEGTCAEEAGLQADDVLLAWDEIELTGGRKLMELLKESAPGDVVTFTVRRDDENIFVEV
ncbi:MAG: M28 family peptidase, partial [Phycisphaerae bacterium]|nr:M28 family peptidase [Phycisphaerae bacterium]